jgi:cell division septal protein FtsQ
MSAPILDQAPAHQPMPTPPRRRRRALTLLTAGTLVLLATGIGVSVAIASRPTPTASAPSPTAEQPGTATPDTQADPVRQQPAQDQQAPGPAAAGSSSGQQPPALTDGKHDAFIRKLDTRGGTVVVDVVQVFKDKAAVAAAIQDGKPRDAAQYLPVYVRNQNPRLRTLPLASGFRVDLLGGCEDSTLSRQALLDKLAGNAKIAGVYYYTLTVKDGAVQRIDEHLAINAC